MANVSKLPPEKRVKNRNISLDDIDAGYLETWKAVESQNLSDATREALEYLRKVRPLGLAGGPPPPPPGAKNREGTKTSLKKRIAELEKRLAKYEPVEDVTK